jgi:hypothetical protein
LHGKEPKKTTPSVLNWYEEVNKFLNKAESIERRAESEEQGAESRGHGTPGSSVDWKHGMDQ